VSLDAAMWLGSSKSSKLSKPSKSSLDLDGLNDLDDLDDFDASGSGEVCLGYLAEAYEQNCCFSWG
jgi:hypothetical protein